jgi:putative transposase
MLLRRSKIFIVNVTRIAVSSVGAAYQANTYTQIYIHIVFAVQGRQNLLRHEYHDELQKYMAGIISGQGQKLIAMNNMPDHFHILIGQRPNVALSDSVRNIKAGSSGFINDRRWVTGRFSWPWSPIRCRSYGATAIWVPITIKISLLRSMFPSCQMSKLQSSSTSCLATIVQSLRYGLQA